MRDSLQPYYWRFQLLGWALFCLLSQMSSFFLFEPAVAYYFLEFLVLWVSSVLASHFIFLWTERRHWLSLGPGKLWLRVLGVCFLMGLVSSVPMNLFYRSSIGLMPEGLRQMLDL